MSDKSYISRGISVKVTLDIDFADKSVVHCNVPIVKITFTDDCK